MGYISLEKITEDDLRGLWQVHNRIVNSHGEQNIFSDVRLIEMRPREYRSENGKQRVGKWMVVREQELIYNPQLRFFLDGEQVGNAIITRLQIEHLLQGELHRLTLYFNTGLELTLHKKTA